jgi:tetratricopeptide (TPR) repeat protein
MKKIIDYVTKLLRKRNDNPSEDNGRAKDLVDSAIRYLKEGNSLKAMSLFEKAIEIEPSNTKIHSSLLTIYQFKEIREYRKCEALCDKLMTLKPTNDNIENMAKALANIASRKIKKGDTTEGCRLHEKALKIDPNCAQALSDMGIIYQNKRQWQKAISYFERYMQVKAIDHDSLEASKARIKDRMASCYFELENYHQAIRYWKESLEIDCWDGSEISAIEKDIDKAKSLR